MMELLQIYGIENLLSIDNHVTMIRAIGDMNEIELINQEYI